MFLLKSHGNMAVPYMGMETRKMLRDHSALTSPRPNILDARHPGLQWLLISHHQQQLGDDHSSSCNSYHRTVFPRYTF